MAVTVLVAARDRFRLERHLKPYQLGTQDTGHFFEHMIAPDAEPPVADLDIGMSISEVPGDPHQRERCRCRDLDDRLGLARDPHHRAVIEFKPVAVAKRYGRREIEQESRAAFAGEHDPTPLPVRGVEHDAIDRQRRIPVALPVYAA